MNDARGTMRISRRFDAPVEEVFAAFTDPAILVEWWAPVGYETPRAEMDVRVGGHYRLGMRAVGTTPMMFLHGEYREVEPPRRLAFTYVWEPEDAGAMWHEMGLANVETLVTIDFVDDGHGTEVRIVHERFPNEAAREAHVGGWSSTLECYREFLARREESHDST